MFNVSYVSSSYHGLSNIIRFTLYVHVYIQYIMLGYEPADLTMHHPPPHPNYPYHIPPQTGHIVVNTDNHLDDRKCGLCFQNNCNC